MMNRRKFLINAGALGTVQVALKAYPEEKTKTSKNTVLKGRIKQGVWRTVFGTNPLFSFEEMCRFAADLGLYGFDLIWPNEWGILRKYGLKPLMVSPQELTRAHGIAHADDHSIIEPIVRNYIDYCAKNGGGTIVIFAGERKGMTFSKAADNTVTFFKAIQSQLEEGKMTIALENVNSRRSDPNFGRPDQVFQNWDWGMEVVTRVNSPNVKLLCDLYHLQISDGDLEKRIRESIDWIAHFHVAGVPNRNEIDDFQEINYRHIAKVIADTGYEGYVSHEWRPGTGRIPLQSILECTKILDV